jgi:hypothetical protein
MCEEFIEHLVTGSDTRASDYSSNVTVVGELFGERKGAQSYLLPDRFQALAGTPQIGFRTRTPNRRAIANTVDREVEHDPSARRDRYAAGKPSSPQGTCSGNQSAKTIRQGLQSRTDCWAGEGLDAHIHQTMRFVVLLDSESDNDS